MESAFYGSEHKALGGLIPATVIPMTAAGDVDWPGLRRYLRSVAAAGPSALAVTADTGEVAHLTLAEQCLVVEVAKTETALPVVAGLVGAPSAAPESAGERAAALAAAGADAFLVFPRADFAGASDDAVVSHHQFVRAAGVPLIAFQLQPALGGVLYRPHLLGRLLALDAVVAIKEASFDRDTFGAVAAAAAGTGVVLLTGNDNFILESFGMGAEGALLGFGALLTERLVAMIEAWRRGRYDSSRAQVAGLQRLADAVFAPPVGDYRARIKECLVMLGALDAAHVRPPLRAVDDGERARLRHALAAAQVEVPQVGPAQVGPAQVGVAQVGVARVDGVAQVGVVGVARVGVAQVGVARVRVARVGAARVGVARVGAAQ